MSERTAGGITGGQPGGGVPLMRQSGYRRPEPVLKSMVLNSTPRTSLSQSNSLGYRLVNHGRLQSFSIELRMWLKVSVGSIWYVATGVGESCSYQLLLS